MGEVLTAAGGVRQALCILSDWHLSIAGAWSRPTACDLEHKAVSLSPGTKVYSSGLRKCRGRGRASASASLSGIFILTMAVEMPMVAAAKEASGGWHKLLTGYACILRP